MARFNYWDVYASFLFWRLFIYIIFYIPFYNKTMTYEKPREQSDLREQVNFFRCQNQLFVCYSSCWGRPDCRSAKVEKRASETETFWCCYVSVTFWLSINVIVHKWFTSRPTNWIYSSDWSNEWTMIKRLNWISPPFWSWEPTYTKRVKAVILVRSTNLPTQ